MKKLISTLTLLVLVSFSISTSAMATTIIVDENRTLGLYGVQWENGIPEETRFSEFIAIAEAGTDTEVILENNYFGEDGSTGFIMVANWYEEEITLTSGIDYAGSTQTYYPGVPTSITDTLEGWQIWWIGYSFGGGTVLDDITRMFATINYGDYGISEETGREFSSPAPVPEPATMLLFGLGLLGLAGISRKKR